MASDSDKPEGVWVPALVIGGEATPEQRARNFDLYKRIRDGVPENERHGLRGSPLHVFVFEVPLDKRVSFGPASPAHPDGTLTFRLDPDGECYGRLCRAITDAFHTRCDADDEVTRLREQVNDLAEQLGEWQRAAGEQAGRLDAIRTSGVASDRSMLLRACDALEGLLNCNVAPDTQKTAWDILDAARSHLVEHPGDDIGAVEQFSDQVRAALAAHHLDAAPSHEDDGCWACACGAGKGHASSEEAIAAWIHHVMEEVARG